MDMENENKIYMNEKFKLMARPPKEALNTIQFGKLKGKSDINPQWRIEALTEVFGLCGVGWYYEVLAVDHQDVQATGEKMIYVTIGIHVKQEDGTWSAPVIGIGGDFTIIKDKNGIHGNDEAFQMALTDALGKAAKCLGIANDIYRGKYDSKYGWRDERERENQKIIQKTQNTLDSEENYRIITPDNVEVKMKNGTWMNLDDMQLPWLELLLKDERFTSIHEFVQKKIDFVKSNGNVGK